MQFVSPTLFQALTGVAPEAAAPVLTPSSPVPPAPQRNTHHSQHPICITAKAKEFLIELDAAFEEQGKLIRILADPKTSHEAAVKAGAERQTVDRNIVRIAWRLREAVSRRKKARLKFEI